MSTLPGWYFTREIPSKQRKTHVSAALRCTHGSGLRSTWAMVRRLLVRFLSADGVAGAALQRRLEIPPDYPFT
jgi:hypothetical protein